MPREGEPAALVQAVVGVAAAFAVACHRTLARELGNGRGTYASRGVEKGEGGVHFRECRIDLGGVSLMESFQTSVGGPSPRVSESDCTWTLWHARKERLLEESSMYSDRRSQIV